MPDRVVSPDERAELVAAAAQLEHAMIPAAKGQIEEAVAMLSLAYPALKVTPQEAAARIGLYARALGDLPASVLQEACMTALQELKFFPSVSEIRERCGAVAKARYRLDRIRHLIAKHDREYCPSVEDKPLSDAERQELDAILRRLDAAA